MNKTTIFHALNDDFGQPPSQAVWKYSLLRHDAIDE